MITEKTDQSSGLECIVVEIDVESWIRRPACTGRPELYLIKDNKVIGEVRMSSARLRSSGHYEYVNIEPKDDATKEFFKDDPSVVACGTLLGVKYDGIFGDRYTTTQDGDKPLYEDTRIVDKFEFDFGICHPSFKDVEGFDNYHKRPKPRHHVPQKQRRPRNSNKIKKIR